MYFEVADASASIFLVLLVGFFSSFILSQVGLTGGIITLGFMISAMHFASPSVSATNLLFVLLTSIASVYAYRREENLNLELGALSGAGGIFGALFGSYLRSHFIQSAELFRSLFGALMLYTALRILSQNSEEEAQGKKEYSSILPVLFGALAGIVSSIFGIGTGFVLMPLYTSILKLPIKSSASSAIFATLLISTASIITYAALLKYPPDFRLGILLSIGGIIGAYFSPRVQKKMHSKTLNKILGAALFVWALNYII